MNQKILLLGHTGIIGSAILSSLQDSGYDLIAVNSKDFNLLNSLSKLPEYFDKISPDVIINCTGFTKIDHAESDRENCFWLNSIVPQYLAKCAEMRSIKFIHFSTDYVFDGTKSFPYTEEDIVNPLNFYGWSKAYCDNTLLQYHSASLIIRLSGIYSTIGCNFFTSISRKLKTATLEQPLTVVRDVMVSPTPATLIGKVVSQIIYDKLYENMNGIYHLTSSGQTTWFDFARHIAESANLSIDLVVPTSLDKYTNNIARRPRMCLLNTMKLEDKLQVQFPDWHTASLSLLNKESI